MPDDLARWLRALPPGVLVSYVGQLAAFDSRYPGVTSASILVRTELLRREHEPNLSSLRYLDVVGRHPERYVLWAVPDD